jgi:hypothetical protein
MICNDDLICCPHCGGEINKNASSCPHCGSDEKTGWSQDTYLDGIDLSEDRSYEDICRQEFGNSAGHHGMPYGWLFIVIGFLLVAVFIAGTLLVLR